MTERYSAVARKDELYRWGIHDERDRGTIAICVNRAIAVKIANALNAQEAQCTKPTMRGTPHTA